ncbi:MAG: hypothetical protein ACLQU4_02890 [Limisphaerales bacterium]
MNMDVLQMKKPESEAQAETFLCPLLFPGYSPNPELLADFRVIQAVSKRF